MLLLLLQISNKAILQTEPDRPTSHPDIPFRPRNPSQPHPRRARRSTSRAHPRQTAPRPLRVARLVLTALCRRDRDLLARRRIHVHHSVLGDRSAASRQWSVVHERRGQDKSRGSGGGVYPDLSCGVMDAVCFRDRNHDVHGAGHQYDSRAVR